LSGLQVALARADAVLGVHVSEKKEWHAQLIASRETSAVLKGKNRRLKEEKHNLQDDVHDLQDQLENEIRVREAARDGADEARCELKREKRSHRVDVQELQRQLDESKQRYEEALLAMQHEHEKDLAALKSQQGSGSAGEPTRGGFGGGGGGG
jgi:predicted RNase H-like nuclease (RuvC/YqgF family)